MTSNQNITLAFDADTDPLQQAADKVSNMATAGNASESAQTTQHPLTATSWYAKHTWEARHPGEGPRCSQKWPSHTVGLQIVFFVMSSPTATPPLNWIPKRIPMTQSTRTKPKDSAQIHWTLFLARGWGLGTRLQCGKFVWRPLSMSAKGW